MNERLSQARAAALALLLATVAAAAQAADAPASRREGAFEFNSCYSGSVDTMALNDGLSVRTTRILGATSTAEPGAPFDGQAVHCTAIALVDRNRSSASGYCLHQDTDGDRWMFKLDDVDRAGRLEFVGGTGKYQGMTLSGQFGPRARPVFIAPGTVQICQRVQGRFELR